MYIIKKMIEVEDRIADQLSGTMIRYITTSIDLIISSADFFQLSGISQLMFFSSTLSQCKNMRMLAEKQTMPWCRLFFQWQLTVGNLQANCLRQLTFL